MAHGCPFISDSPDPVGPYYNDYLSLDTILKSQHLVSEEKGHPAHDEMLFIIIHQVLYWTMDIRNIQIHFHILNRKNLLFLFNTQISIKINCINIFIYENIQRS